MRFTRFGFFGAMILGAPFCVLAAEPVRHVPVYVHPYYQAGATPNDTPIVAVAKLYDQTLASKDPESIRQVAQAIDANAGLITPMTLMVLAIRHYDVGLRDESVFWFYAAKNRYSISAAVLDMRHPALAQARQATVDFANLAGMVINGYAFCDLNKQATARARAEKWVEAHPYEAVFLEQLPARPGDRRQNMEAAIAKLKADNSKEVELLSRPETLEEIASARRNNGTDQKYCW